MKWTPAKMKKLRALWEEGKTAGQIVEALGGEPSRSAVIGKARRMNLSRRPSPLPKGAVGAILSKEDQNPS